MVFTDIRLSQSLLPAIFRLCYPLHSVRFDGMADDGSEKGRLDSWKEIALYVGRDVRTVIRWEKQKGLPVHRIPGGQRKAVFAYRDEIDRWRKNGDVSNDAAAEALPTQPPSITDGTPREEIVGNRPGGLPLIALSDGSRSRWLRVTAALASVIVAGGFYVAFALQHAPPELTAANPTRITQSQTRILSPLLTDGARVFYPQYENSRYSVAEVPAKGGQSTAAVTDVTNPELCDLSQSSQAMLLRNLAHSRDEDAPVFIQPKDGSAQRVGSILAYDAAWYPDASRILYSADGGVYSSDRVGNSRQRLFSVPGNAYWFRWAPDGRKFRFTVISTKNEATSIWEAAADGTNPHRLFPELQAHLCCGTWTPDGKFYVFQVRVGNTFQIWAQRVHPRFLFPAKNQPFPLIFGAMNYRGPLVSGNGRKLFVRTENQKGELMRYDPRSERFLPTLPSIPARTLAFSQDGKWLAYTSLADNDLWRCRADGNECLQLTQNFKQTVMPRWSPDGRTIAFMGIHFGGKWGIYTIPADGGAIRSLSNGSQPQGDPDWSPDGQRLVFGNVVVFGSVPSFANLGGIYILDLHTQKVSIVSESTSYFTPRWSPDGRSLVALHADDGYLCLFDFASKTWRRLAEIPARYPNWSRDGKYVYFSSSAGGSRAVFRVAVADRAVEKVGSLSDVGSGSFFMSDWVGLAPDDAPLAINDLTTEDIYAWDLIAR